MNLSISRTFHVHRVGKRSHLRTGEEPTAKPIPVGRLPRVTKLMALAIRFDSLLQSGMITDYASLARLGHVTRARVTQIMNLLLLSPRIQEEILFLPTNNRGCDPVLLAHLQSIAQTSLWTDQERMWRQLIHGE